eukprot:1158426-Pelagomonas_calceolata.AAC.2
MEWPALLSARGSQVSMSLGHVKGWPTPYRCAVHVSFLAGKMQCIWHVSMELTKPRHVASMQACIMERQHLKKKVQHCRQICSVHRLSCLRMDILHLASATMHHHESNTDALILAYSSANDKILLHLKITIPAHPKMTSTSLRHSILAVTLSYKGETLKAIFDIDI